MNFIMKKKMFFICPVCLNSHKIVFIYFEFTIIGRVQKKPSKIQIKHFSKKNFSMSTTPEQR